MGNAAFVREMLEDLGASDGDPMISESDWVRFRLIQEKAEAGRSLTERELEEIETIWKRLA